MFPPLKGGGGAQKVLPCVEGRVGHKKFQAHYFRIL